MLKDKLNEDLKVTMKSGNTQKRDTLRMLMSAIKNREIDKRTELNDEQILEVVASEVKKRRESISQFSLGGRSDLVEKEQIEIDILYKYLPEQLDESSVREAVISAIKQTGASNIKDVGRVMSAVMAIVKGKADGTLVSKLVKEELTKSSA